MKKKNLKQELLKVYQIPPASGKQDFFQSRRWNEALDRVSLSTGSPGRISFSEFLRIQAGYIRLRNWLLSFVLFFTALLFSTGAVREAGITSPQFMGILSACIPYLALATVAEGSRSVRFGMEELEMHTRFSLHSIVCARLFLTGIVDLLVIGMLIPFLHAAWGTGLAAISGALLIPYLLTCSLDLMILRRLRSRNSISVCAAASTGISAGCLLLSTAGPGVWNVLSLSALPAVFLLGIAAVIESKKYLRQSEESIWNYTSTV